jgi:hypothetical protein
MLLLTVWFGVFFARPKLTDIILPLISSKWGEAV